MLPGFTPYISVLEPFGVSYLETRVAESSIVSDITTWSAVNAGKPDPRRYLVAVFSFRTDLATFAVTIGGVAANIPVGAIRTVPSPDVRSYIAYAYVPDQQTVDVVVDWAISAAAGSVSLYRVTNPGNLEFDLASGQAATTINGTMDVAAGGAVILGANQNNSAAATLSGVTEDFEGNGANWRHTVGHVTGLPGPTRNVGVTGGASERTLVGLSISPP